MKLANSPSAPSFQRTRNRLARVKGEAGYLDLALKHGEEVLRLIHCPVVSVPAVSDARGDMDAVVANPPGS